MIFPTSKVTDPTAEDQTLHSIVRGRNDYQLADPTPVDCSEATLFWRARYDVAQGKWPHKYFDEIGVDARIPKILRNMGVEPSDPLTACMLVDHTMDHPLDLHKAFLDAYGPFPTLKDPQAARSPEQAGVDFLGARTLDATVSKMIELALIEAFQTKYFFAVARPEHIFGTDCAVYQCPPHPAYPAGHGAIAGATVQTWIDLVELDDTALTEMETIGMHYAHYRTLAGVHWPQDNTAGYRLGAMVTAKHLQPT